MGINELAFPLCVCSVFGSWCVYVVVSVALQCMCVWFVVINEAYHIIISEGRIYSELFPPLFFCLFCNSELFPPFVCFVMWSRMNRIWSSVLFMERVVPNFDGFRGLDY
jgi:hypothetical protein